MVVLHLLCGCCCSTQLALQVDHKSYALIFGFNTFLALLLQTILTLVVADERGLALPIPTQVGKIKMQLVLQFYLMPIMSLFCVFVLTWI